MAIEVNKQIATAEWWHPSELTPYITNTKKHPIAQIDKVAASIAEFGFDQPIVVDGDGVIIKGHARREASLRLGLDAVPVIVRTDLTPAQVKAARIADNRVAESEWDLDALKLELGTLQDLGFNLELTGFDDIQLGTFLADKTEGLTDPDDAPPLPEHPVTQAGDLWHLGRHRLLCGDSTVATDVERVLGGVEPHLMVTDPPYGVNYDPNWRNEAAINGATAGRARGVIGGRAIGKVENDLRADWSETWALYPGDVAYVWHGALHCGLVGDSLIGCGFELRSQIIWAKNNIVISRGHYHFKHEPCWYAVRKTKSGHWTGDRKQSSVWEIDKPFRSETGHGTQKPVECMRRPIENNSSPGQAVYEPFSGSGTTIIAAEMTGRSCHAIEISPAYVDVALRRWQDFAGKQATLDGDGRAFDEVAAQRRGISLKEVNSLLDSHVPPAVDRGIASPS